MSPDGTKLAFLMTHSSDAPIAIVYDFTSKKSQTVLASEKGEIELNRCGWANDERLLCGYYGIARRAWNIYPVTRLVAVNSDASEMKVLLQSKLKGVWAQFQDQIVDRLPDDPKHVLIEMPDGNATGVVRLDIYSGGTRNEQRSRKNVRRWVSDGRGALRLRFAYSETHTRWWYTLSGEDRWRDLHKAKLTDLHDTFEPVGFGAKPNSLLVLKQSGNRDALYSEDLANDRKSELIFAHPDVDVDGAMAIGKYNRIVAVSYSTDRPHLYYFDETLEKVSSRLEKTFPGELTQVVDESWDRSVYIVHVSSDRNPGAFYRFDTAADNLTKISSAYPKLAEYTLAPMEPVHYEARDGAQIPAYITTPHGAAASGRPAVILPHGGPHSRDDWGYDWLPQYFAARGYVVLQSNYRGSGGFGLEWLGEGAYQNWRTAINDIDDGLQYLIDSGAVDPERVCIVGWSYGGYAALMSAAENPARYRCVVSIAGVTDLARLADDSRDFIGGAGMRAYIGTDKSVLVEGSPVERAADIQAPVLLFHGDKDVNVFVKHSSEMEKALKRRKKDVAFFEYEGVAHGIRRNEYRIDMLTRIGAFLDRTTRPNTPAAP